MESSNAALRRKNDEAAARELRELRADTISGLKYARDGFAKGSRQPVPYSTDYNDLLTVKNALAIIERRWPA